MEVTTLNIDAVHPYDNNPRDNLEAIDKVAESIKSFGFQNPIIVDKNNVILAGHTRLEAAKKLEIKRVPVIVADNLSEQQAKEFRIADNKSSLFASWDMNKLQQEFDDLKKDGADLTSTLFSDEEIASIMNDFDVNDAPDLEDYQEPEKEQLVCPACGHIDSKDRFKKV